VLSWGKSRAVKQILKWIPKDTPTLCSPFIGGGSLELACAQRGINVIAYDNFQPLVNFWQACIKDTAKLAETVRQYIPLSRTNFYLLQKNYFNCQDTLQKAAIFFVLNRASFSGTTFQGGMSPGHPRLTKKTIDALALYQINHLHVRHADFKASIPQHANDFLYLDPPYLIHQKLYGHKMDIKAISKSTLIRRHWQHSLKNEIVGFCLTIIVQQ
jgi:DNA adenine methylase